MTVGKRQGFIIINLRACMYVRIHPAPFSPFQELTPSFLPSFLRSFDFSSVPCICIRDVHFFFLFFFLSPSKRIRFRIFEYRAVSLYSSVVIIRLISTLRRRECFESSFLDSFKYLNPLLTSRKKNSY